MDPDVRARAEGRLAEAAQAQRLADPRPPYRERLRHLREAHPDAFGRAIQHYEERVLPELATRDPLPVWIEYGRFLGGLTADGQLAAVDDAGRARAWDGATRATLVLFIPSDTSTDVLVTVQPAQPTPAQQATLDLLVNRKLAL